MNPSDKRKSEYRKMKAAFEWNDWPVPTPQSFHHWTLARQVDHLVPARRGGTGPRFHGSADGAVLTSPPPIPAGGSSTSGSMDLTP